MTVQASSPALMDKMRMQLRMIGLLLASLLTLDVVNASADPRLFEPPPGYRLDADEEEAP